jgi:hypothetical protein
MPPKVEKKNVEVKIKSSKLEKDPFDATEHKVIIHYCSKILIRWNF